MDTKVNTVQTHMNNQAAFEAKRQAHAKAQAELDAENKSTATSKLNRDKCD